MAQIVSILSLKLINNKSFGKGEGNSKKEAESKAAQVAIALLCDKGSWSKEKLGEVNRITLPASANANFYPSLPESAHAALIASSG